MIVVSWCSSNSVFVEKVSWVSGYRDVFCSGVVVVVLFVYGVLRDVIRGAVFFVYGNRNVIRGAVFVYGNRGVIRSGVVVLCVYGSRDFIRGAVVILACWRLQASWWLR